MPEEQVGSNDSFVVEMERQTTWRDIYPDALGIELHFGHMTVGELHEIVVRPGSSISFHLHVLIDRN